MDKTKAGHIITNPPRAVLVTVDGEVGPHSAVAANVTILTENRSEAQKVLDAWEEIAVAINLKIEEVIGRA